VRGNIPRLALWVVLPDLKEGLGWDLIAFLLRIRLKVYVQLAENMLIIKPFSAGYEVAGQDLGKFEWTFIVSY
jgi:hypothetical protein